MKSGDWSLTTDYATIELAMDGTLSNFACHVAVLYGGDSSEREISLASGQQAALALSLAGHQPVLIDPAEIELHKVDWRAFDICFIALHGGAGEDGRIQAKLDQLGVRYTGSFPEACGLAMRKSASKRRFANRGVPTPSWFTFAVDSQHVAWSEMEFPVVIKPDSQGSSLGVSVAHSANDLQRCIAGAGRYDSKLIAERLIVGREFTVSLLGRDPLPLLEIVAPTPIFSYDAKYASPITRYRFDSKLIGPIEAALYRAAISAAEALGTSGLVRVDLMLDSQNRPWVLELNAIPGLTARSLSPRAAGAAGIDMPALVDWMIRDALARTGSRGAASNSTGDEPQIEDGAASILARIGAIH
ncbi:MAG TPA: D-alanine--D-alanine ligase [Pirellulales bacterium]